jgi:protein tyrosine kinase modulator
MCQRKFKAALAITAASFMIMVMGMLRPSNFTSSVTIFADNQNIIKPLLGSKASMTSIKQNRTTQVSDVINSPRILSKVIEKVYGSDSFAEASKKDNKISQIRNNLMVKGLLGNYIKITYTDDSAKKTFDILNNVVFLFIEDSANSKKEESRSAYNFIEQQTASYKNLLLSAETKLKNFQSNNFDGSAEEISARIASLRATIEEMKIEVTESSEKLKSLQEQLAKESKYSSSNYEAAVYRSQLQTLEQIKAELQLKYKDDYPEIIKINYKIADIKKLILSANDKENTNKTISSEFNPLYKELRSKVSDAAIEKRTMTNRLKAFENLLTESYERRKRIANNNAELSELTRDYSVLKAQYEDMLEKKEKARISMVLDVEGQGVNYKIQEAASYPNTPSGLRFIHFFILGPFLGFLLIFFIILAKIFLDGRIRLSSQLGLIQDVTILARFTHISSKLEIKRNRQQNVILLSYSLIMILAYVFFAFGHKYGFSIEEIITFGVH